MTHLTASGRIGGPVMAAMLGVSLGGSWKGGPWGRPGGGSAGPRPDPTRTLPSKQGRKSNSYMLVGEYRMIDDLPNDHLVKSCK